MSLHISGVNVSMPLDWIGRAFAKVRFMGGPVEIKKGAKYQINGEWFFVESVLQSGLIMRLVDKNAAIKEAP